MRNAILAGPTLDKALGLVRLGRLQARPISMQQLLPGQCVTRKEELLSLAESAPSDLAPLINPQKGTAVHLYVSRAKEVYASKRIVFHVLSSLLPAGAFLQLCEGVLVPSWPLYYAQRCSALDTLSQRLKLGMELCGSYSHLVAGDESTSCFYREANSTGKLVADYRNPRIVPACSVEDLSLFLSQAYYLRGGAPARFAAKLLLDGSASPSETLLALMISLPYKEGGYGFKDVELNPAVPIPPETLHLTSTDLYHPDCYLPAIQVDLESQSYENHLGRKALVRDASRRNDIQTLGIEVKDVTWDTVSHLDKLDRLALQLIHKEKELGVKGAASHEGKVKQPDNKARRKLRLGELLPPWPYEQ
ncbi:MAG: hypothetical protein IJ092_13445 [Atopobiaceae bacterium]|nr:hypothetical protein [Atopobiaceae bacterium]